MDEIMSSLQRKHENEVADLHATVDRLLKVDIYIFFHRHHPTPLFCHGKHYVL